jgi:hypothetical protein
MLEAMSPDSRRIETELGRLRRLAHVLDEVLPLPGGYRIGAESLLGLIPGVGDSLGAMVAAYIVFMGARLGVSTATLLRMIGNVALDLFIGAVPLLGDLFDFTWKANMRNVALIERGRGKATRGRAGERRLAIVIVVLVALALAAALWMFVWLVEVLVGLIPK